MERIPKVFFFFLEPTPKRELNLIPFIRGKRSLDEQTHSETQNYKLSLMAHHGALPVTVTPSTKPTIPLA